MMDFKLLFFVLLLVMSRFNGNMSIIDNNRPEPSDRKFTSVAIDDLLKSLTPYFRNQDLAQIFNNCLPNTLDTTVYFFGNIAVNNDFISGISGRIIKFTK